MEIRCAGEICLLAIAELDTFYSSYRPTELQTKWQLYHPPPFLLNHLTEFKESSFGIKDEYKVTKMDTGKQGIK
jgi:hypothetical protein